MCQFNCLFFGISSAPRIFTKLLRPVISYLRKEGIRLVVYLDDILIVNETQEGAKRDFLIVVELIQRLGFLINWPKSVPEPAQILEYLGLVIDSRELSFTLPKKKALSVQETCSKAIKEGRLSLSGLASLLGNFSCAIPTIPFTQAHYRNLQNTFIESSRRMDNDLKSVILLKSADINDLQWWIDSPSSLDGKSFFRQYQMALLAGEPECVTLGLERNLLDT